MGAVADAALAGGADVIGVLPDALKGRDVAHMGLLSLESVPTMHERKARFHELADAFIVLPGGFGTFEELLETITWAQIGLHAKPCILINTANYWNGLLAFLDTASCGRFHRGPQQEPAARSCECRRCSGLGRFSTPSKLDPRLKGNHARRTVSAQTHA